MDQRHNDMNRTLLTAFLLFTSLDLHAAVTGTVLGDDGKPLAGARVRIYPLEGSRERYARMLSDAPERAPLNTAETKDDGTFTVDTKSTPLVDVDVDAPGRQFLRLEGIEGEDLGIVMLHTAPMRKGRVIANGKPVAGARVVFARSLIVKTDEKGEYQVPETSGVERVLVIHPDFAIAENATVDSSQDLTMAVGTPIRGKVSGADGKPVAHATISVNGWPLAQSGDDGSFTVPHAPQNWRTFIARSGDRVAVVTNRGAATYEVKLRPAATLTGSARSTKGDGPVAGALVMLTRSDEQSSIVTSVTDAKGRFTIDGLPAGEYGATLQHPAYLSRSIRILLAEGASASRVLPALPLARLSGRVIGEDKQPIAGARVGALMMQRLFTFTNAAGGFTVRIAGTGPMGRSPEVTVSKQGYATARYGPISVAPGENKSGVTIVLPSGFPLDVKAVDRDNKPVAGVAVGLQRWNDDAGASKSPVSCRENDREHCRATDANGVMHFQLSESKYDVQITGDTVVTRRMTVMLNARSSPLVVSLERGVEISGRVTYTDGSLVSDASLHVRSDSGTVPVQADGTFVIQNAVAGKTTLVAEIPGNPPIQSVSKQVTAPATGVVLMLTRNGRIEGRVVDKSSQNPLPAFQLTVIAPVGGRRTQPHSFNSDDGSFSLDVEPGLVDVAVDAPGYVRALSSGVKIEEGKSTTGIELQLDHGGKITGRVTSGGQPVAEANVVIQQTAETRMMLQSIMQPNIDSTTTDANGEFTLDGIAAGDRVVSVTKADFARKAKTTEVTAGRETHVDIELDRGLELHGRVVDHDGRPLSDVHISVREAGRGPMQNWPAVTDVDGTFRISGLGDSHYAVTADKSGFVRASIDDVLPSAQDLTITLNRGGSISGRVTGVSDAELSMVFVAAGGPNVNARAEVDSTGNFTLQGIPDGRVMVSALKRPSFRSSAPKAVDVVNGSAPPVELSFDDANAIRGRVTRGGAPVDGGSISFLPTTPEGRSGWATISQGLYEANNVTPGDYNVTVRIGPAMGLVYNEKHSVRSGETYDIDIHGATVRGRVLDDVTGAPLSDVAVWLDVVGSGAHGAPSDSDGKFSIDTLSDGTYTLRAQKDHYAPTRQEVVVAGGDQDIEVRLKVAPKTAMRIVDARDNHGMSASVWVRDSANKPLFNGVAKGDDGTVSIWLEPGTYTASVWSRGYVNRQVTITVPGPELLIALQPAGKLIINVRTPTRARLAIDPAGQGASNAVVGVIVLDPGASFPFETLAPGSYVVKLFGEGQTVAKTFPVTIVAGETVTVTVE
jgi:uncharacterized GH25 family protein